MFASAQRAMAAQSCDVIVVVGARGSENTSGRLSDAMIASIAVVCVELRASRVMINSITAHHHPPHTIIYTFRAKARTVVREKSSPYCFIFDAGGLVLGKELLFALAEGWTHTLDD
jgi:thiamine pyrophosphate-dependent acetolactate synthase large subunit-like protein